MATLDYQAVLFDLDGTLLDTAPDFAICLNQLLIKKNRPPLPAPEIRALVSNGSAGLIAHAFQCREQDPAFSAIREEFLDIYLGNLCRLTRPFPGIETLLARLGKRDTPWGIVTNKPDRYTRAILDALDLQPAPQTVICPDHVTNVKPHPEPVLKACLELNVAPQHVVFVGDHRRDIESGRNAGTATVAAAYGYIDDDCPHTWGAHRLVNSAEELHDLLF